MIKIDVQNFFPHEFDALPEVVADVIPKIVDLMRDEVAQLASQRLQSSKQEYLDGLRNAEHKPVQGLPQGNVVATLTLEGFIPNAIENGWDGGDMKPALLAGGRTTKSGSRVAVVNFPMRTPGGGRRAASAMGNPYMPSFKIEEGKVAKTGVETQAEARALGRRVYQAASRLGPDDRLRAGMAPKLRSQHKTDIYAGMKRQATNRSGAYSTFRSVSSNSDPSSWIHPGIEGHEFFQEAQRNIGDKVRLLLSHALTGLTKRS